MAVSIVKRAYLAICRTICAKLCTNCNESLLKHSGSYKAIPKTLPSAVEVISTHTLDPATGGWHASNDSIDALGCISRVITGSLEYDSREVVFCYGIRDGKTEAELPSRRKREYDLEL